MRSRMVGHWWRISLRFDGTLRTETRLTRTHGRDGDVEPGPVVTPKAKASTSPPQTRRYTNESNLKVDLELLGHGPVETEHPIPGGSIDIYVPHYRFVVETKARGAGAGEPLKRQPGHDESPKEQLDRSVLSEIRTERPDGARKHPAATVADYRPPPHRGPSATSNRRTVRARQPHRRRRRRTPHRGAALKSAHRRATPAFAGHVVSRSSPETAGRRGRPPAAGAASRTSRSATRPPVP